MSETDNEIKAVAPYVPFKTLRGLVERLHSTAVSPVIDSSVLHSMSGSIRSQIMSSLRFLGLISINGEVSEALKGLVESYQTEGWAAALKDVILSAYVDIIDDVNLQVGTDQQLDNAFRRHGNVDGQMLDKATRFFLAALGEAQVAYSPHFGARKSPQRPQNGKKTTKKKRGRKDETHDEPHEAVDDEADVAADMEKFRFPIRGKGHGLIIFPSDMDQGDWLIVRKMLDAYFGVSDQ